MRTQSQQTISEVQKIWYRVMSILYRSGGQSVRIPSSNELAQEFGIARSTVRIALEKLTAEGFLITRRGSGTFTNPKCRLNANWEGPLVGLLMHNGNLFFYSQELQNELECFFAEFRETGWNIRLVTGQMDTPEAAREILSHNYLDSLISFGSSEFIPRTADAMLPTVNMGFFTEGLTNVTPACSRVLNKLFELTGRDRGIRVWTAAPRNGRSDFIRAYHAHPGLTLVHGSDEQVPLDERYEAAVREEFLHHRPDWILIHPRELPLLRRITVDLYGESGARRILWVFHTLPATAPDWPGYFVQADRRTEIRTAIDLLRRKMNHESSPFSSVTVEARLIRVPDQCVIA